MQCKQILNINLWPHLKFINAAISCKLLLNGSYIKPAEPHKMTYYVYVILTA